MIVETTLGDMPTTRQHEAIEHRGSNLLVEAVPGSGKTRVIVERARGLLRDGIAPERILILTFSRRAVGELQRRLADVATHGAMPEIRTFHGFAARLLAQTGDGGRSRRLLSEPAERALFEHVVTTTALPSLPQGVATSRVFLTTAATAVDDLRRAPDSALAQLANDATPRVRDLLDLVETQRRTRDRLGVADFDDLIARAARLAATPGSPVANALADRYAHVLVDEFQDTDAAQLALLERLGGEIFAVGDAAQAIYGFRGAARDAMTSARTRLAMTSLPLDESFRCPQAICDLARSVWPTVHALTSRVSTAGEIAFRRAATPHDEASFIGAEVAAAIASGTPPHEIAVLVRSAKPLAGLATAELRARGIAATRQGGENVFDDLAVDAICAALGAFTTPSDPASWVRLFGHPAFVIDPLAMRLALRNDAPRDVASAVRVLETLSHDERARGARLAAALRTAHPFWLADEPVRAARAFAHDSDLLGFVIDRDEDAARSSARHITLFLDALADVRDIRQKLGIDVSSATVVEAFLAASTAWHVESSQSDDEPGVKILTVHAAKGLEFECVVIADAVEGHFPQLWRADTLVSPRDIEIARELGIDLGTRADEHDDEERSLWYVATTRAKRRLVVTWSETDADGSPLRASRFLPLDARTAEEARASFRGPLTYRAATELTDAQVPTPARLTKPIRTSAMESWFSCRRKFYYGALLRIGSDERGFQAKLGTLVHRTIATFHAAVRDFRHVDAGSQTAWATALQDLARALVAAEPGEMFDSPLEAEAALRAADRLLIRYARELESAATTDGASFEVIATEERVEYTAGGIAFRGSIDRVDRRADGSLALVDVKTGKLKQNADMVTAYPKLADEAASGNLWVKPTPPGNPQLPLYRHAKLETTSLAYLYLGSESKSKGFSDVAKVDRLDVGIGSSDADRVALEAIDRVLTKTFFEPWTTGQVTTLEPTRYARACRFCEYVTVCPGFQEDEE